MLVELTKYDQLQWSVGDWRGLDVFLRGDCAMVFTFGDIVTSSQDTRISVIRENLEWFLSLEQRSL
jgi:hypothetical protein